MKVNEEEGVIDFNTLVLMNEESLNSDTEVKVTVEDLAGEKEPEKKIEEEPEQKVDKKLESEEPLKKEPKVSGDKNYNAIAKRLLEKGDWEDGIVEVNGEEIKLSELDELDEETFYAIWDEQKESSKEDYKKSHISIKEVSEDKLRLINIIKSGANLREIFENENQIKKPFEGVDLEDQQTQQSIYYNQLLRQNIDGSDARDLVIKATKDFTLDTKAKNVVEAHQKHYSDSLKKLEKETADLAKVEADNAREYKKSLQNFYKEEGLEDSFSKTLVEAGTKVDNKTGQMYIDTVYEKLMEDPKKAKDLIFFMLEQEKFLSAKGVDIKTEVEMKNLKKFKIARETSKTSDTKIEVEDKKIKSIFDQIELE